MIPTGDIYAHLREQALHSFSSARPILNNNSSLREWFHTGAHTSTKIKNKKFELIVDKYEYSSAVFCEIEHLLDHCTEHIIELAAYHHDANPRSDAWNVVTIYYFAFFSALALLRLTGQSLSYLNSSSVNILTSERPGGGTYLINYSKDISSIKALYNLNKQDGRIHDSTWRILFCMLDSASKTHKNTSPEELLFYELITSSRVASFYKDEQWPSAIRSLANYRPGYAYQLASNTSIAKTKKLSSNWIDPKDEFTIKKAILNSSQKNIITQDYNTHVKTLHDVAFSLYFLLKTLYKEVVHRNNLDKRWEIRRKGLFKKHKLLKNTAYSLE